jgi:hypothetical protein
VGEASLIRINLLINTLLTRIAISTYIRLTNLKYIIKFNLKLIPPRKRNIITRKTLNRQPSTVNGVGASFIPSLKRVGIPDAFL